MELIEEDPLPQTAVSDEYRELLRRYGASEGFLSRLDPSLGDAAHVGGRAKGSRQETLPDYLNRQFDDAPVSGLSSLLVSASALICGLDGKLLKMAPRRDRVLFSTVTIGIVAGAAVLSASLWFLLDGYHVPPSFGLAGSLFIAALWLTIQRLVGPVIRSSVKRPGRRTVRFASLTCSLFLGLISAVPLTTGIFRTEASSAARSSAAAELRTYQTARERELGLTAARNQITIFRDQQSKLAQQRIELADETLKYFDTATSVKPGSKESAALTGLIAASLENGRSLELREREIDVLQDKAESVIATGTRILSRDMLIYQESHPPSNSFTRLAAALWLDSRDWPVRTGLITAAVMCVLLLAVPFALDGPALRRAGAAYPTMAGIEQTFAVPKFRITKAATDAEDAHAGGTEGATLTNIIDLRQQVESAVRATADARAEALATVIDMTTRRRAG